MDMHLSKLREIVGTKETGLLQSMGSQRFGHDLVIEHSENGSESERFFLNGEVWRFLNFLKQACTFIIVKA